MPDRSTLVSGLQLILSRLQQLALEDTHNKEELQRQKQEAQLLKKKWERLIAELERQVDQHDCEAVAHE
jgi:predicted nuclease with TOPRIM domain